MALQTVEAVKALFLYGRREMAAGIPTRVIVTVMQTVYLQFQYQVPLKADINRGT